MQNSLFSCCFEGLFSENYVRKHYPETDIYKQLKPIDAVRKSIISIFNKNNRTVTKKNEAQLEDDLIKPILQALGVHYIVQVTTSVGSPDYAIFKDEESRERADQRDSKRYEGAIALADAKRWGRPLDRSGGSSLDNNPNAIPAKQIANYISDTGISWGVLTDGQKWRLYCRNVAPVSQSFFEMDLQNAVEDPELFHLFCAVFSGPAFACEAQNYVLNESKNYWSAIGEDLKERAYKALEKICNGFFTNNPKIDIRDIYEASVIFLYRLLFILNAESRGLFQIENTSYSSYSMKNLLPELQGKDLNGLSTYLWSIYPRLQMLFSLINKGDISVGVYRYNGGLFKEEGFGFIPNGFFENNRVPDRFLAEALLLIGFASEKKKTLPKMVDYRELDVRHLGSIYEGLLEFHPRIEDNQIILYTDKGDKKRTGSYYTPDYIVDYIVKNTLKPITDKMRSPDEVLALKVLDPAMGSGHFLVGAVDFIGRRCIELAGEESELNEKDYQRLAVEKCIYGVDINPLAVELAKLSLWLHTIAKDKPLSFLDHHLKLGNSLIGARISDLDSLPSKEKQVSDNQQSIFSIRLSQMMPNIVREVMGILGRATIAIEDIEFKEQLLQAAKEHLKPFITIANLWISSYFGNDVNDDEYRQALDFISTPRKLYEMDKVGTATEISYGNGNNAGMQFFHWELEFPEIYFDERGNYKQNPGFDAVIGNPPYVDVEAKGYFQLYETQKSANLYAYFLERGFNESKVKGRISMIVPLSLVCSSKRKTIREFITMNAGKTSVATFGIRPSKIFPNVDQRTAIIITENNKGNFELYTTKYNRWNSGEEYFLISNLSFIKSSDYIKNGLWPKIGDLTAMSIIDKIFNRKNVIKDFLDSKYPFYFHSVGRYWLKAYTFKPVFKDENGESRESTDLIQLNTNDKLLRDLFVSIINSSLFYFVWNIYSDDFHCNKSEIKNFPIEVNTEKDKNTLHMISLKLKDLMNDYNKNSILSKQNVYGKNVLLQIFKPSKSKHIINDIDLLLSVLYGLNHDETEYLIHYDDRFRMAEDI